MNESIIRTRKGEEIIVPSVLYADLSQYCWYLNPKGYAVRVVVLCSRAEARKTGQRRLGAEFIHRRIYETLHRISLKSDDHLDHRNRNPLNNMPDNLRLVGKFGGRNQINVGVRADSSTGVKGVHWHKRDRVYVARTSYRGRRINIGYFDTIEEATEAYNAKARELHGEFAYQNGELAQA